MRRPTGWHCSRRARPLTRCQHGYDFKGAHDELSVMWNHYPNIASDSCDVDTYYGSIPRGRQPHARIVSSCSHCVAESRRRHFHSPESPSTCACNGINVQLAASQKLHVAIPVILTWDVCWTIYTILWHNTPGNFRANFNVGRRGRVGGESRLNINTCLGFNGNCYLCKHMLHRQVQDLNCITPRDRRVR